MSINLNSLQSIQSLLTQFGIGAGTAAPTTTANFSDYLMDALDSSKQVQDKKETNGLYELIAGNSTSTSMQGLLGLGDSSIMTQYLQGDNSNVNATLGFGDTGMSATQGTADLFSSYLQTNFQSKITESMNAAKLKLQTDMDNYRANNDGNDELVKLRLQQMEQNVSLVSNYLQPANATAEKSSTEQQLMDMLSNNGAYSKYLVNLNS